MIAGRAKVGSRRLSASARGQQRATVPAFVFRFCILVMVRGLRICEQEESLNPESDLPENQTPAMARFKKDVATQKALANTVNLADVKAEDFDTVFYPGGHGPMWDLAESPPSIALLEAFYNSGRPIAWFAIRPECFATLPATALRW
jgi:putative intracellular protease/amidase